MSKVTLIRPPAFNKKNEIALFATPPIGLAYLAAMIKKYDHECSVIDAIGEALEQRTLSEDGLFCLCGLTNDQIVGRISQDTDLIGVSCGYTKEWPNYKILLEKIKEKFPAIPIVCGGEHITAEPEFSMKECQSIDFCILGEGEQVFVDLLAGLEKNLPYQKIKGLAFREKRQIVVNDRASRIKDIDDIPYPLWEAIPIEKYLDNEKCFGVSRGRSMPMLATRGCPFKCSFCSSSTMWDQKWIPRDPEKIIGEIRKYIDLYRITNIDFYDMTTIINKEWIIEFSKLIIQNDFNITWQLPSGTRAEAITKEVCDYMYEAGCRNLAFSPESASPRILKQIDKKIEIKAFTNAIKEALNSKMNVKVNLIFGFPQERHSDILINLKYIIALSFIGVHDLSIWSFAPYPGSKIYSELKKSGRIKDFNKDYLSSLIYADIFQEVSWNEHMSVKWINFYRLLGHIMFYFFSCIFHPVRALKVINNLFTGKHESRTEKFIAEFFKKKKPIH